MGANLYTIKPDTELTGKVLDEAYEALYNATGIKVNKNGDILKQLNEIAINISSYTKSKDSDMVACMMHTTFGEKHMVFPKDAFQKRLEVPFEMGSIYIPGDPDAVLSRNYGAGYMVPNAHSPHDYPYYKMQERWVRNYVMKNPDMAVYMPANYIVDVYDENPEIKALLDQIYGKTGDAE